MKIMIFGLFQDGSLGRFIDAATTILFPIGADVTIELVIKKINGAIIDLTSKTITMTVRKSLSSSAIIKKNPIINKSVATFSITPDETKKIIPGRYLFDIWMNDEQVVPISGLILTGKLK
jgi:hypothetical protein